MAYMAESLKICGNNSTRFSSGHYGVRTAKWKLIYYYGKPLGRGTPPDTKPDWELFDMQSDPHEMKNLYHDPKYASVVKQLKAELERSQ